MMVILFSLTTKETKLILFSLIGGGEGDGDGDEVEDGGEEDSSEDEDQVTETGLAQSLEGKEPVYHHEI